MPTPYDGSYKHLFSHPEMVESLIRDFVPEDWVRDLDFTTLEKQNASYVSDDLRERHDDLIWRLQYGQESLYIYLLLEFQSSVDPWMAVRIPGYLSLLYQDLIKANALSDDHLLPMVFPFVLYNGRSEWHAPRQLLKLIQPVPPALQRYCLRTEYFLMDIGRILDEELATAKGISSELMRLERSNDLEYVQKSVKRLSQRLRDPEYQSLRRAFAIWIRRVLMERVALKEVLPAVQNLEEVDAMLAENVQDWTQKWVMQGVQRGRMEGEILGMGKGRAEGLSIGRSSLLGRLLARRFGAAFDARFQARLQSASVEQLDQWGERILDARTIEEVFAPLQ